MLYLPVMLLFFVARLSHPGAKRSALGVYTTLLRDSPRLFVADSAEGRTTCQVSVTIAMSSGLWHLFN